MLHSSIPPALLRPSQKAEYTPAALGTLANHVRNYPDDTAGRAVLRHRLDVAKLNDRAQKLAADMGPLSTDEREVIVALFVSTR